MITARTLPSDNVTDRDIFNYITEQMIKQGVKSTDQWYNEEDDIVEDGEECRYFGYDMRSESDVRCAIGLIMNEDVFKKYESEMCVGIEGNGIQTIQPLEVVVLSNENWKFTKESWVMLSILQRIHDLNEEHTWQEALNNMSLLFDSQGKFCPSYLTRDCNGDKIEHDKLYFETRYDSKTAGQVIEEREIFVDFEDVGISFKIPSFNSTIAHYIADTIRKGDFHPAESIQVNILQSENQQTADISAKNFLDIMDAARLGENHMKEIISANK